jgi:hypothetical protein
MALRNQAIAIDFSGTAIAFFKIAAFTISHA